MRVLIAPDGYKGSLEAVAAAAAIARGWAAVRPDDVLDVCPLSDGGEGFLTALGAGGTWGRALVPGPLGEPVEAPWVRLPDGLTVAVELSAAAGLTQVPPDRRDPLLTTTYGVGALIAAAWAERPFERLVLGLGGSATVDGGAGLLEALGVRLLDAGGRAVARGGGGLADLAAIALDGCHPVLRSCAITVACDVDHPLLGAAGAAPVFGPQKGADPARVRHLELGLTRWAAALEAATGVATGDVPGTGAAGGVLAGLLAVAGATRASGFELVAEAAGLDARLARAELVLTGEGRLDATSFGGKVAGRLASRCQARGLRCLVIAGGVTPEGEALLAAAGGAALPLVAGPTSLEAACAGAGELLEAAAGRLARLVG
ncbi:MAG: glycerate kinase [Candidatus Sericytochromatia bacterium]|nr:glycerate kinase [Candidatus Sericytochromatia bacterium]